VRDADLLAFRAERIIQGHSAPDRSEAPKPMSTTRS